MENGGLNFLQAEEKNKEINGKSIYNLMVFFLIIIKFKDFKPK